MSGNSRAAVFIDQTNARFITCKYGFAAFSGKLESGFESHPRYRGEGSNQARFGADPYHGSNNEYHRNLKEEEIIRGWFKQLEENLRPYSEILLIGPGEVKKELRNHLLKQKEFQDRHISLQNSDHITDRQLLARAQEFFQISTNTSPIQE